MTEIQNLMLSVCFGAVVGMLIGDLLVIVGSAIHSLKEKHRKRKQAMETADKAE